MILSFILFSLYFKIDLKKQQQQFIGTLSILLLLSFYASNVDQKRKFNTKQQHPKPTSPLSSIVFTIIFYSSPNMKFLRQKHRWNKCESESLIPKSAISYSINACTNNSINSHLYMYCMFNLCNPTPPPSKNTHKHLHLPNPLCTWTCVSVMEVLLRYICSTCYQINLCHMNTNDYLLCLRI